MLSQSPYNYPTKIHPYLVRSPTSTIKAAHDMSSTDSYSLARLLYGYGTSVQEYNEKHTMLLDLIRREHPLATITRVFGDAKQAFQELEKYHTAASERLGPYTEGMAASLRAYHLGDFDGHVKRYEFSTEKVEERARNYGGFRGLFRMPGDK